MTCAILVVEYAISPFLLNWNFVPQTEERAGLEGAGGPVGFEPAAEKCGVVVTPRSSASGLVTAVDNTVLVSSSRRAAPEK
jgi:hypothetical protein